MKAGETMKNRIKEFRTKKDLTQKECVKSFNEYLKKKNIKGVTTATWSRWENGLNTPTKKMWNNLADFFDVPVSYLRGANVDEIIEQVDFKKLSPLGLFFYENESSNKDESLEATEIKLHENMLNSILYSEKGSALESMNKYIEFLSKLKDKITTFDNDEFLDSYLNDVVAEYWWDDTSNSDLATVNHKLIREVLKRVENGDKELRNYIVKKFIYDSSDMLESYFEYKKNHKEDITEVKDYLNKLEKEFKENGPKLYNLLNSLKNSKIVVKKNENKK